MVSTEYRCMHLEKMWGKNRNKDKYTLESRDVNFGIKGISAVHSKFILKCRNSRNLAAMYFESNEGVNETMLRPDFTSQSPDGISSPPLLPFLVTGLTTALPMVWLISVGVPFLKWRPKTWSTTTEKALGQRQSPQLQDSTAFLLNPVTLLLGFDKPCDTLIFLMAHVVDTSYTYTPYGTVQLKRKI